MKPPETRYAKSGDVHIAYQVIGEGPRDLVFVPGFVSHLEATWITPQRARFFERLASFARLILFDKRGTGMSDRTSQIFTLEQRMDDARAVMDATGSERAALFGLSEGGPMSILFAATYPERTVALVIYGSYARRSWARDHPWGLTDEQWAEMFDAIEHDWVEQARYMAERIPGAKLVELPGTDHVPWFGDTDAIVDEVEEFLTGVRHGPEPDRVLATVLFTDIVGSTERAASLGDRRWRELLDSYYAAARRELGRFRGRELDTAGDGVFAAFDGPARGVRCAQAIAEGVHPLGIEIRAGLHTGECEVIGDKLGGIAVHIGARVAAHAGPGEVLVTHTVKDLVAGSELRFQDRGAQALKGVPGEWRLFAVERG